jgi:hypothetical protein
MRRHVNRFSTPLLFAALVVSLSTIYASERHHQKANEDATRDEIQVIGHIAIEGPTTQLLPTQHFSSFYLYAEHGPGKALTLIDVTKASDPTVVNSLAYPANDSSGNLIAVAGMAGLAADRQAPSKPASPAVVRIMNFTDPSHPRIAREFQGVTAITTDNHRQLIYVADAEGIWILREHFAEDPEITKEYSDYVQYGLGGGF